MIVTDAEHKICKSIHHFILFELTEKIDENAFAQNSMTKFGHYLFGVILQNVPGSTNDFIKTVVKAISHKDAEQQDEYIRLCCSVLRFVEVPRRVYIQFLRQFVAVFMREYRRVIADIKSQIDALNVAMDSIPDNMDSIILASNNNTRITKDIRESEKRLSSLNQQCNELRTKKEMLQYSLEYLDECMSEFCSIGDKESALMALRKKAIDTARDDHFAVDDEFKYYREILSTTETNANDILRVFYIVKLHQFHDDIFRRAYDTEYFPDAQKEKILKDLKEEVDSLPGVAVLREAKSTDIHKYRRLLDELICKYDVASQLKEKIKNCVSIGGRKVILLKAIASFESGDFDLFNNIIPLQLEGLFGDYLKDGFIFYRFTNLNIYPKAVLREKITYIKNLGLDVFPEAVLYFNFYFNNLIRNKIAHGNYKYDSDDSAAAFAMEMLLDLNYLIHMLSRKSETEKMYRLIDRYKAYMSSYFNRPNHHFEFLFNDLIKTRTHFEHDSVEKIRPIQFAYWLVNPYYEEVFARVGDVAKLRELRSDFLSNDFWLFVLDKLDEIIKTGYDFMHIDREFYSVVKALFACDLTDETKKTLAKVNAALSQIKKI